MAQDLMELKTPARVASWTERAESERDLGMFLEASFAAPVAVLHDRLVPDYETCGTIDHLVIASSGVWVIESTLGDSTRASAATKRDLYETIDRLDCNAAAVRQLLEVLDLGIVPVHPALCDVRSAPSRQSDADVIDGVLVLSPDKLHSVARQPGFAHADEVEAIAAALDTRLLAVAPR